MLESLVGISVSLRSEEEAEGGMGLNGLGDPQGVLLQIFTQPVSDRPTVFLEVIQRIGCMTPVATAEEEDLPVEENTIDSAPNATPIFSQAGGCGSPPPPSFPHTREEFQSRQLTGMTAVATAKTADILSSQCRVLPGRRL